MSLHRRAASAATAAALVVTLSAGHAEARVYVLYPGQISHSIPIPDGADTVLAYDASGRFEPGLLRVTIVKALGGLSWLGMETGASGDGPQLLQGHSRRIGDRIGVVGRQARVILETAEDQKISIHNQGTSHVLIELEFEKSGN